MRVYRLEGSGGFGPYTDVWITHEGQTIEERLVDSHGYDDWHLGIFEDLITPYHHKNLRCACLSLPGLKFWFGGFWWGLIRAGYRVHWYEIREENLLPTRSMRQVGFSIENVEETGKLPLFLTLLKPPRDTSSL